MKRILLLVAGLLLAATLLGAFFRAPLQAWVTRSQPLPVGGQILLPTLNGLTLYNLSERRESILVPAGQGEVISAAAWSPDHTQIAYALFHRRQGDPTSVVEIYLARADGASVRVLAERDRPGAVLDTPSWSPDGRAVFFSYFGQASGRVVQRIERVMVEDGARSVVVEDGYNPTVSPDGQRLLFVRDDRAGTTLWLISLSGGDPSPVLGPGLAATIGLPRFSPDGGRFAVSLPVSAVARANEPGLLAWLLPPIAYAHGEPADIWTFDLQGNDARRITQLNADDPTPTWSPDGRYIALWSGSGLYLVGATGGEPRQLLTEGGYGSIDWRP